MNCLFVLLGLCCIIYPMLPNERIDHLERLLEVVRGLTTAPDLDTFLQSIISEASELTNSELSSILEYDSTAEELRFLSMQWFERDLLRPMGVPLDGSAAGWVFRKGQPLIIQDTKADKRHFAVVDRITKHDTQSLVAVPLMVRGEVIGVLEALNKRTMPIIPKKTRRSLKHSALLRHKRCATMHWSEKSGELARKSPSLNASNQTLSPSPLMNCVPRWG